MTTGTMHIGWSLQVDPRGLMHQSFYMMTGTFLHHRATHLLMIIHHPAMGVCLRVVSAVHHAQIQVAELVRCAVFTCLSTSAVGLSGLPVRASLGAVLWSPPLRGPINRLAKTHAPVSKWRAQA